MLLEIQSHILSIKHALKNIFLVSISTLFHVGQDLFLNFFSSSSGFVTPTQNKLLKWGAKDASGDGSQCMSMYPNNVFFLPILGGIFYQVRN